jgi:hypothetical protein
LERYAPVLLNIRVELMTLPDLHPSFLGDTSEMLFMTTPTIAERYADTRAVKAYAALSRKAPLVPFEYAPQPLGAEDIEIAVDYCGICHSDISMIDDAWGYSAFPLVPGHEVIGTVAAIGRHVEVLRIGQRVGLGWQAASCMACHHGRAITTFVSTRSALSCIDTVALPIGSVAIGRSH